MSHLKLLVDEHLPLFLAQVLCSRLPGLDALRVGKPGAPPFSTDDPRLLDWCEQNGRILVTGDFSTIPVHFLEHLEAGHHSAGIIFLRRDAPTARILDDLGRLLAGATPEDWIDRIVYVPLSTLPVR